jgi:hypothetical protein
MSPQALLRTASGPWLVMAPGRPGSPNATGSLAAALAADSGRRGRTATSELRPGADKKRLLPIIDQARPGRS